MKSTTLQVPTDQVDEVLGLLDNLHRDNAANAGNQALFRLWTRLSQIFPKQDFTLGDWRLDRKRWNELIITDEPVKVPSPLKLSLPEQG